MTETTTETFRRIVLDALLIPASNVGHRMTRGWDCTCVYILMDEYVDRYQYRKGCEGLNYVHEILDEMSDPDECDDDTVRAILQTWKDNAPSLAMGNYVDDAEWTDDLNALLTGETK